MMIVMMVTHIYFIQLLVNNFVNFLIIDEFHFKLPRFSHFDYKNRNKYLFNKCMESSSELVSLPIDDYEYVKISYS